MDRNAVEGFEIPIHRSLTEPILIAGAPRALAIINGTITAALGLQLRSWLAIPLGIAIHVVAAVLAKRDPDFVEVFIRHLRLPRHLSP
jgi:type IV secretory pathway TrbD component